MGKIISRLIYLFNTALALLRTNIYYRFTFSSIGKNSTIASPSRIIGSQYINIGDNTSFGNNLRIEAIESYAGESFRPFLTIGDNVAINQNFHCTCAEKIVIEDGTSITANCGVFDIIHPYQNIEENPRKSKIVTKPVHIGKDCLIGMNSVILPGTRLGNHCVVGANSTVCGDYPDYCVIAGSPAKIIKKYDFDKKSWIKLQ